MDRNISQIKSIFPHLGEGYIETALACYNHDLEQTTITLMESENGNTQTLHPRLKAMDKSLPARKQNSKEEYVQLGAIGKKNGKDETRNDLEEEEARNIQKEHIQSMIQKQEEEAYNLGIAMATTNTNTNTDININDMEYNDDYDDQYDAVDGMGVGGTTANADSGLYDIDYDAIKTYNKVTKEMEADRLFWEENRNDNRRNTGKSGPSSGHQKKKGNKNMNDGSDSNDSDQEMDGSSGGDFDGQKKYRGPDKGKGGRLIGPDGKYLPFPKSRKKGGGKPKGNNQNSKNGDTNTGNGGKQKEGSSNNKDGKKNDNLTKIQKRRKNDNKAKIGNHHRKERALKKSGM